MVQQLKKTAHTHSAHSQSPNTSTDDVHKKVDEIAGHGAEKFMHAADKLNNAATECTGICSDGIGAFIESGNVAIHLQHEIGNKIIESCTRAFSDCTEFSQEILTSRNISEIAEIQNKALQQMSDNYLDTTNKICSMWFDSFNEVFGALASRTAGASKQVRKAFTA